MKKSIMAMGLLLTLSTTGYADPASCPDSHILMAYANGTGIKNNGLVNLAGTDWLTQVPGSLPKHISDIPTGTYDAPFCKYIAHYKDGKTVEIVLVPPK